MKKKNPSNEEAQKYSTSVESIMQHLKICLYLHAKSVISRNRGRAQKNNEPISWESIPKFNILPKFSYVIVEMLSKNQSAE